MFTCAVCKIRSCKTGDLENMPMNCPCKEPEQEEAKRLYTQADNVSVFNAALVESEGYCKNTRLEEIMEFARKCGYQKLGLAFCTGLSSEAEILCSILKNNGFEVESVICKNGSIPKEHFNIQDSQKVRPGTYEPICNPIGQAMMLNKAKTQLNIMLGLCVGHDTLFIKYSKAPITVFAVKDRVLAHNPLGAIYLAGSYYKKKLMKE